MCWIPVQKKEVTDSARRRGEEKRTMLTTTMKRRERKEKKAKKTKKEKQQQKAEIATERKRKKKRTIRGFAFSVDDSSHCLALPPRVDDERRQKKAQTNTMPKSRPRGASAGRTLFFFFFCREHSIRGALIPSLWLVGTCRLLEIRT